MQFRVPNLASLFARKQTAVTLPENKGDPKAGLLYDEEAVTHMAQILTRMPDTDEVLRQAGLRRFHLRALMTDDEIYQATSTRADALQSTPVTYKPLTSANPKNTELLKGVFAPHKQAILQGIIQARWFGYSVLEAVYADRFDGVKCFSFIGEKPMEWFEPKSDGRLIYYPDDGSGGAYGFNVDQVYKFFLTRVNPTYRTPYGEALLSRLYWPWWFRTQGWKFWGKFLERFGSPLLVGMSNNPDAMVQALLLAHSQAVIGVGQNDKVEAVGLRGDKGESFDLYESAILRRIQKVILGQTLTSGTDGGSGNRALGQVHESVRTDKRNSDLQLALPVYQRLVNVICFMNNWQQHEVIFEDDVGLNSDQAERDNKLYTMGVRFTPPYYESNYALRADDFTLASEAPPSNGLDTPPGGPVDPNAKDKKQPVPAKGKPPGGTKASLEASHLFIQRGDTSRFTKQQQLIEAQADAALEVVGEPLSIEKVRSAVAAASSPEDLATRLFALLGDEVSQEAFNEVLTKALFAADVMGYVHAEGKV